MGVWQDITQTLGASAASELAKADRYYLLTAILGRADAWHPWLFERCREVEANPDGRLDLWSREFYKDLANETPMLTANRGWTTHGDLVVGDSVFSPEGKPVRVLAVTEVFDDSQCYRLTFSDGATIVCGAGHLWRIREKHKHRINKTNERRVVWTHRVVETHTIQAHKRHDVGVCAPLEYPEVDLPVHPYVLGTWLGDGNSACAALTVAYSDSEVLENIMACGVAVDERSSSNANTGLYTIGKGIRWKKGTGLTATLREMGVLNNKHIPDEYMRASVCQRMELLRGLMDTDGHCSTNGQATFCQVSSTLARQVYELATSLGLRPKMGRYENGGKGFWQVRMRAHIDRNPFKLSRKALRAIAPSKHREVRSVVNVERVSSVPTRCIQVDGEMYAAGRDLVPTHNSTIITFAGSIQEILRDPEITIGIFSHTRPIAKGFLRQIKTEFESNDRLKRAFPAICWASPKTQAPKWSEDDGIVVQRKTNPKEATIEAWGLVDGQPTSKHYRLMIYDDVVTKESVSSPEMIRKTTEAWELSRALGASDV